MRNYEKEYFTTIVYAEFGGQTECIMGNSKIVNLAIRPVALSGYGAIAHEAKPNGLLIRGP